VNDSGAAGMREFVDLFGGHMMSDVSDPYPVYAELRRRTPVRAMEFPLGPTFMVTRYDDVMGVLKDAHVFSSGANGKGIGLVMGRTIIEMDGQEHGRHRNLVAPAFLPKAMRGGLDGVIEHFAQELLDAVAPLGRADLVSMFTRNFPVRVIAHLIGIPVAEYASFQQWSLDLIGFASEPLKGFAASEALVQFLKPQIASRRSEPRDDLLSVLIHSEVDGHRLTDEEVYSFIRLLLPAGAETTFRLIGTTLLALLSEPELYERVRSDRDQIQWALEEALRWDTPVQFVSREATRNTSLQGIDIPQGHYILVALGSANRDEQHFADPDRFDLDRHPTDHVSFGFGRHFCVGSHLARLEATIGINAVLDRLPNLRLDPVGEARVVGLAFRSPKQLAVIFDAAQ
jgi:cytochrome P450